MNNKQAVLLAIDCIKIEIQRLTIAANLQDRYQANLPHTITASEKRILLCEAIAILKGRLGAVVEKSKSPHMKPRMAETQPNLFDSSGIGS
jgi:hypothetical protein